MVNIPVDPNLDRAQRRISQANLANFAGVDCQLLVVKEDHRPVIMDGVTTGGAFKVASVDELNTAKSELEQDLAGKQPTGDYLTKTEAADTYLNKDTVIENATHATTADSASRADLATNATSADTAVKATQDGQGRNIVDTYATKTQVTSGLAGKAEASHTHEATDITGLDKAISGKADVGHTHTVQDISDIASNYLPLTGGAVTGELSAASFKVTSDKRLKKNIEPLINCLSKVHQIGPYTYELKNIDNPHRRGGILAQELIEAGFPEAVYTMESGFYSVDYQAVTALLLGAIKELEDRIKVLEGKL